MIRERPKSQKVLAIKYIKWCTFLDGRSEGGHAVGNVVVGATSMYRTQHQQHHILVNKWFCGHTFFDGRSQGGHAVGNVVGASAPRQRLHARLAKACGAPEVGLRATRRAPVRERI